MDNTLPNILEYAEYRKYLRDCYQVMKSRDKRFSQRHINFKVGVKSAGCFADLLSGRQKLIPRQVAKIAAAFELGQRDQEVLQVMADIERAATPEEREAAHSPGPGQAGRGTSGIAWGWWAGTARAPCARDCPCR